MWNPGIQYKGSDYIYQGITGAANSIAGGLGQALQKYDDVRKQNAFGDATMDHLSQTTGADGKPFVPVDALTRYHQASSSQKAGMVQAALANATFDAARQNASGEAQLRAAQAGYYGAHSNYMNAQAAQQGQDSDNPITVDPLTDPSTQQPVPGMGIVRKTGAIVSTGGDSGAPNIDPSGKFYLDNKTRSWKPLPGATMVLPGINPQAGGPVQTPGPQPAAVASAPPQPGSVIRGYRFNGGDPKDPNSWSVQ